MMYSFTEASKYGFSPFMLLEDAQAIFAVIDVSVKIVMSGEPNGTYVATVNNKTGVETQRMFDAKRTPSGYVPSSYLSDDKSLMLTISDSGQSISAHKVSDNAKDQWVTECIGRYFIKGGFDFTWDHATTIAGYIGSGYTSWADSGTYPTSRTCKAIPFNEGPYVVKSRITQSEGFLQHLVIFNGDYKWSSMSRRELSRSYGVVGDTLVSTVDSKSGKRVTLSTLRCGGGATSEIYWRSPEICFDKSMVQSRVNAHVAIDALLEL